MYVVFLELMIQHAHVYRTGAFIDAILNICQCRVYFSYFFFSSFCKFRISQILQCAFMWKGHWKRYYLVQFSKPFYWKHSSNIMYIYIYIFYRILQNGIYPHQKVLTFASNGIKRSRRYDFSDDNRKLENKLSKYEAWE